MVSHYDMVSSHSHRVITIIEFVYIVFSVTGVQPSVVAVLWKIPEFIRGCERRRNHFG